MRILIFLFIAVIGSQKLSAQELNQYKYVLVPQEYEFLKEENQYRLNELTVFLFEKYGFEALYKEEVPAGTGPCEVLAADVLDDSGLFTTKLQVELRDCHNKVVFTSGVGETREKNYKKAYHLALRDAFESIAALDYEYFPAEETVSEKTAVAVSEEISASEEASEKREQDVAHAEELPAIGRFFRNGNTGYYLEETSTGFTLLRGTEKKEYASLIKSGGGENYIYTSENAQGNAYFDDNGNLLVEYVDPDSGQLLTVKYELQE